MHPESESDPSPRVVVITSGGEYAERVLLGLALDRVVPHALLVVENPPTPMRPSPRRLASIALRRALRAVERTPAIVPTDPRAGLAREVRRTGPINGEAMLADLRELAPDYLVLGGLGILGPEALAIPSRGTLNAHPALLPWVRGVDVVERSIERRVPVGVTAHFVAPGIDTGRIIRRELIPVRACDMLGSLRKMAVERCARLLAELASAAARGEHPASSAQGSRYPYSGELPREATARLGEMVGGGLALELYREWSGFYGSDVLPEGEVPSPPVAVEPLAPRARRPRVSGAGVKAVGGGR